MNHEFNGLDNQAQNKNFVKISGLVHFLSNSKNNHKYFPFALRHENIYNNMLRKDFLNVRVFPEDLQEKIKSLNENDFVELTGVLRSSRGSGELYLAALEINKLDKPENFQLENQVELSGFVHVIKAQSEGETGTGKYTRFAVRQENHELDGQPRKDFLVVRVYDEKLREKLATKSDSEPVSVTGTLRSSRGSGVNYVRCVSL